MNYSKQDNNFIANLNQRTPYSSKEIKRPKCKAAAQTCHLLRGLKAWLYNKHQVWIVSGFINYLGIEMLLYGQFCDLYSFTHLRIGNSGHVFADCYYYTTTMRIFYMHHTKEVKGTHNKIVKEKLPSHKMHDRTPSD